MYQLGKLEQLQAANQQPMKTQQENEKRLRLYVANAEKHRREVELQGEEKMRQYKQKMENNFQEERCRAEEERRRVLEQAEKAMQQRDAAEQARRDLAQQRPSKGWATVRILFAREVYCNQTSCGERYDTSPHLRSHAPVCRYQVLGQSSPDATIFPYPTVWHASSPSGV